MKCLIYCHEKGAEWTHRYFSDADPYMLPIGNKPLLEFFVEFCSLNDIKDIYIAQKNNSEEVKTYFEDGTRWNINLDYISFDGDPGLEEFISSNKELFNEDSLLVFNGFFFLQYKKSYLLDSFIPQDKSWKSLSKSENGLLFLKKPCSYSQKSRLKNFESNHLLQAKNIDSVKAYFDLNMDMVVGAARNYVMPSYNNEKGVFIGQNVEIMYDCEITKPIILADNIQLKRRSRIGPSAIIGSNSLIDSDTTVRNSVICSNSYIGTQLEIDNKIIYKRCLIDPDSGEMIHIIDDFLLAEVNNDLFTSIVSRLIEMIFILLLFIIQLPLYIIVRPWLKGFYEKVEVWRDKGGVRRMNIKRFVPKYTTKANKLFMKCSLDKFVLLPLCMTRKLRLIGSAPREANKESLHNISELSSYRPSAFSYSDMYGYEYNDEKRQVNELFYAKHASIALDIAIFFKTLIFNFFGNVNARRH
jgi:Nucleotidyl transferase